MARRLRPASGWECGDRHLGTNDMYFGGCHNGDNQKFYLETYQSSAGAGPARMRERSSSMCLDWHTGNNNLCAPPPTPTPPRPPPALAAPSSCG